MKHQRWILVIVLAGISYAGAVPAQGVAPEALQQPSSIREMGFQTDSYGYAAAVPTPAASSGTAALPASPSNMPPPPVKAEGAKPEAEKPKEDGKKEEKKDEQTPAEDEGPYKLFHNNGDLGQWEDCHHLDLRGYVDVGWTGNPARPADNYNGPVGYNDRANELDLNQLYFTAERLTKVENDCGIDYGYRADLLYGTDRRYVQALPGSEWDSAWDNGNRFYGLAVPQLYGQLQIDKLTVLGGHFYAPCNFEVANSDGNFFYSRSLGFIYAPTTLTGGYATYKLKDKLLVNVGFDTGENEGFEAVNGKLNGMFGVNWTSADKDGKLNVVSECFIGNSQVTGPGVFGSTRTIVVTDITFKLSKKWRYVLENSVGHDTETPLSNNAGGIGGYGPASWTGWTNYWLWDINDCWGFGARYEYYEDLNGAVVSEDLTGSPFTTSTLAPASRWQDATLGLNWKPNKNVTIRTEARWDWASNTATAGNKAFDNGQANGQFVWGNDIIIRF